MAIELPTQAMEIWHQIPNGVERPGVFIAAGAVAVLGTAIELYRQHGSNTLDGGIPPADSDIAERARQGLNRSRRFKRFTYYSGLAFASFYLAQASQPYAETTQVHGGASVVLDVGYRSDAQINSSKSAPSRLQAAIEGSLRAAQQEDVPFTFIVEGTKAQIADRTPATGKDLKRTSERIVKVVTPVLRNGEDLASGVELAAPSTTANDVIIIASDMDKFEQQRIKDVAKSLKQTGRGDVSAIVEGDGSANYTVGVETLTAQVNSKTFEDVLGAKNVYAAHSAQDVTKAINKIVERKIITHERRNNNFFADIALGFGALGAAAAMRQRLSGMFKRRSRNNKEK